MTDSLSGHTAAQNTAGADGLRDGDALSAASLSNMLQGLNGNGIVRLEDSAFGSTRNSAFSTRFGIKRNRKQLIQISNHRRVCQIRRRAV